MPKRAVAPSPPGIPAQQDLRSIGETLAAAWEIYQRRGPILISLLLLALLPVALVGAALFAISSVYHGLSGQTATVTGVVVAGLAGICVVSVWSWASLIYAVADETLSFREALAKSWPRLGSFLWLSLLLGFIVQGGIWLLVLPGLILTVWFFSSQFLLAGDDCRGMSALMTSKRYVEGHFLPVALRCFLITVSAMAAGSVPVAGPLLSLLFFPFATIFLFLVYRDLRQIKSGLMLPLTASAEGKQLLGLALLGHAFPLVILFSGVGGAMFKGYLKINPFLMEKKPALAATAPRPTPPAAAAVKKDAAEDEPTAKTAAEYDALIAAANVDFESGTKCSVGPAAFLLDQFWDDANSPHVWLKVKLAPLPNLEIGGRKCAKVEILNVSSNDKSDLYNAASPFEKEFFHALSLQKNETPPHLVGQRDVQLRQGSKESDILSISGNLILTLPERIETVKLDAASINKENNLAGAKVTLKELVGKTVSIEFNGDYHNLLKVIAYDRDGKRLAPDGDSWTTEGTVTRQTNNFSGQVHSVKIIAANSMLERKFPFELRK